MTSYKMTSYFDYVTRWSVATFTASKFKVLNLIFIIVLQIMNIDKFIFICRDSEDIHTLINMCILIVLHDWYTAEVRQWLDGYVYVIDSYNDKIIKE